MRPAAGGRRAGRSRAENGSTAGGMTARAPFGTQGAAVGGTFGCRLAQSCPSDGHRDAEHRGSLLERAEDTRGHGDPGKVAAGEPRGGSWPGWPCGRWPPYAGCQRRVGWAPSRMPRSTGLDSGLNVAGRHVLTLTLTSPPAMSPPRPGQSQLGRRTAGARAAGGPGLGALGAIPGTGVHLTPVS